MPCASPFSCLDLFSHYLTDIFCLDAAVTPPPCTNLVLSFFEPFFSLSSLHQVAGASVSSGKPASSLSLTLL